MVSARRFILVGALLAAAICVPIVFFMQRALMPSAAELARIDAAVQQAAPPGSALRRLSAPNRIQTDLEAKSGYFTYDVATSSGRDKYRAEWRITGEKVELLSLQKL